METCEKCHRKVKSSDRQILQEAKVSAPRQIVGYGGGKPSLWEQCIEVMGGRTDKVYMPDELEAQRKALNRLMYDKMYKESSNEIRKIKIKEMVLEYVTKSFTYDDYPDMHQQYRQWAVEQLGLSGIDSPMLALLDKSAKYAPCLVDFLATNPLVKEEDKMDKYEKYNFEAFKRKWGKVLDSL